MRLAIVEWVDSTAMDGWRSRNDMKESPLNCVTCGIVLETPKTYNFVQSVSDGDKVSDIMIIPKCAVKRIRYLKLERELPCAELCASPKKDTK